MIEEYKRISSEIFEILKSKDVDENELEAKFDKRQHVIDKLDGKALEKFREDYKKEEIFKLDEEIKTKLQQRLSMVRKELSDYKENKAVNFAYANANKTNLNIFSKKV